MRHLWRQSTRAIAGLTGLMTLFACASQLPRSSGPEKKILGTVDLAALGYVDLATDVSLTLADYVVANDLNYVLLSYGSVGCAQCNVKAKTISQQFLGSHQLFVSPQAKSFELIGVATDSGGAKKQFMLIWNDEAQRKERGYDFVRWLDESGRTLADHIIPANEPFGVPYMLLVNRRGEVLLRVPNNDHRPVGEILDLVATTIGLSGGPGPNPKPSITPEPPPPPPIPDGFLRVQLAAANRFADVQAADCDSTDVNVDRYFGDASLMVLQVARGACDRVCEGNIAMLRRFRATCQAGASCSQVSLMGAEIPATHCSTQDVLRGGQDLLNVFRPLFDWNYGPVIENGVPQSVPEVKGPIVMAFDRDGQLRFAKEGAVAEVELQQIYESLAQPAVPAIVDFQLYGDNQKQEFAGNVSFAQIRQKSKYTVVAGFDPGCGSCVDELKHWSEPSQTREEPRLMQFCKEQPDFCQVYALETYSVSGRGAASVADLYEQIKREMDDLSLHVPTLVDRQEVGDGFSRFFEGYLAPLHRGQWPVGEPGTVIYDREGKILAGFRSVGAVEPDPVLQVLKTLRKYEK